MTQEELKIKYPDMFGTCWDFSINKGWLPLIENFCRMVVWSESRVAEELEICKKYSQNWTNGAERLAKAEKDLETVQNQPTRILQIKEKFGGLRLYFQGGLPEFFEWARFAENLSLLICEDCGVRAEVRTDGWIRTLCRPCGKKFIGERGGLGTLTEI